jgi:hypothetical protein
MHSRAYTHTPYTHTPTHPYTLVYAHPFVCTHTHILSYTIPISSYATTAAARSPGGEGGGALARGFVSDLEHTADGSEELHLVAYGATPD